MNMQDRPTGDKWHTAGCGFVFLLEAQRQLFEIKSLETVKLETVKIKLWRQC